MPRELIEKYLRNPVAIAVIAAVVVLLIVLVVWLYTRSRKRKREREASVRAKLVAMERETQFTAAVDQVQFSSTAAEVARVISRLFEEYLSMMILAIYAGREGEQSLSNILAGDDSAKSGQQGAGNQFDVAGAVSSSLVGEYWRPKVVPLSTFASEGKSAADTDYSNVGASAAIDEFSRTGEQLAADSTEVKKFAESTDESRGIVHAQPATAITLGGKVVVIPWRGAYGWNGLIVAPAQENIDPESLSRYRDALIKLGNRLGVALELERERGEVDAVEQRTARTVDFFRSLITALDNPSPFASIARELASLVSADSAAVWRIEPGTSMIRMVAAYGLRSAEFLPLPLGQGLAGRVVESEEPLALEDAPADPRCLFPREARESGIGSYLGAPVMAGNEPVGVIEVHTVHPKSWTPGEIRAIQSAASVIGEVLKNSDSRGNRLRVESAYLGLSEAMQRLRSRDEVMGAAVEVLGHALGVSRAIIVEFDNTGSPLPVKHEFTASSVKPATGATFTDDLVKRVSTATGSGGPIEVNDSRQGSLLDAETATDLQVLSELAVPIRFEGQTRGIIYLHQCDRIREWRRDEVEFADRVGRQLSLSLSNVQAMEAASQAVGAAREDARRNAEVTARTQGIIKALPEAVLGIDKEGRLAFFNPAAREWLGLNNEDLGRMAGMTEALSTSEDTTWDKVIACDTITRFRAELTQVPAGSPGAQRVERKSGALVQGSRPVGISVSPMKNEQGQITGHLVVINDLTGLESPATEHDGAAAARITELEQRLADVQRALSEAQSSEQARAAQQSEARAQQEIQRLREDESNARRSAQQLLEINRLKSEFIVNAGHELEASLQSVLGFAELLLQGSYGQLSAEQDEAVKNLYAWAKRMRADVDTLIEYGSTRSRRLEEAT